MAFTPLHKDAIAKLVTEGWAVTHTGHDWRVTRDGVIMGGEVTQERAWVLAWNLAVWRS